MRPPRPTSRSSRVSWKASWREGRPAGVGGTRELGLPVQGSLMPGTRVGRRGTAHTRTHAHHGVAWIPQPCDHVPASCRRAAFGRGVLGGQAAPAPAARRAAVGGVAEAGAQVPGLATAPDPRGNDGHLHPSTPRAGSRGRRCRRPAGEGRCLEGRGSRLRLVARARPTPRAGRARAHPPRPSERDAAGFPAPHSSRPTPQWRRGAP